MKKIPLSLSLIFISKISFSQKFSLKNYGPIDSKLGAILLIIGAIGLISLIIIGSQNKSTNGLLKENILTKAITYLSLILIGLLFLGIILVGC